MDDRLNTAPCGFLCFSESGSVLEVNATLLDMLGYRREDVLGRHVQRLLTVGARIFYQTHWFPLLRLHGRAEEIFLLLRAKDGAEIGALVNAVRREVDGITAFDCVLMRVLERKRYEEELLHARRAAEKASAEAEAHRKELAIVNEQLVAQTVELELQQQQLHEQALALEEAMEELTAANEGLVARQEEAHTLRVQAEEANRAKSNFLAVMSHELRTPLNAIAGYVQLIEMGIHGPVTEAQMEALGRVSRSQSHLLRLINDVLDLSRIEAGRVEYLIEEVPVSDLVAAVAPMVEPQFAAKSIDFTIRVEPDLAVRADREKVQQILINLLGNAVKFTPPGGRVRLEGTTSAEDNGYVVVRVTDTGIGIPAEKLEAIFQPFVQVRGNAAGQAQGTGLGLAISRDLARGMRGRLTAASAPGKGSVLTLSLPAAPDGPA